MWPWCQAGCKITLSYTSHPLMTRRAKQNPQKDLPAEGSALPSELSTPEGIGGIGPDDQDSMPTSRTRKAKPVTVSDRIKALRDAATDMVMDREVLEADWPVHLRHKAQELDLSVKDGDLSRWLGEAKAHRDGRIELLRNHHKLNTRPTPWLWEGVIQKHATNLIHAMPKCGKTRLIMGAIAAWIHGSEQYLGRNLNQNKEKVLIVGPDQPESVWAELLQQYQLLTDEGHLHERIVGLIPSGANFALTEVGIRLIEAEARENPGLVIVLDSYQRAIGPMGIDENRPEAAIPMTQLMEAIAPHNGTLIVIHHSNKTGGDGSVASGSRGHSSLTAQPDQLIQLKPLQKQEGGDQPKEIQLETAGRAGKPVGMVIQLEDDGRTWVSLGSVAKHRKRQENQRRAETMTALQQEVLMALVTAWEEEKTALTGKEVLEAIGRDPVRERTHIHGWMKAMEAKGWVAHAGDKPLGVGKPARCFKPTLLGMEALTYAG